MHPLNQLANELNTRGWRTLRSCARHGGSCVPRGVVACRAGLTRMRRAVRRALAAARNSNTDIAVGQPRHPALTSPHAGQTRDLAAAARPHPASSSLSGAAAGARAAAAPGGDHGPVSPVRFRAADLAAHDCDLVPQYQDLHVFGDIWRARSASQPDNRIMSR
jgi:hypothetical protein